ncbi:MAG: hypothetical protein RIQ60_2567 [Pseudomonadota bacterium]|jgi:outer membrane biosynthesis protein TonB
MARTAGLSAAAWPSGDSSAATDAATDAPPLRPHRRALACCGVLALVLHVVALAPMDRARAPGAKSATDAEPHGTAGHRDLVLHAAWLTRPLHPPPRAAATHEESAPASAYVHAPDAAPPPSPAPPNTAAAPLAEALAAHHPVFADPLAATPGAAPPLPGAAAAEPIAEVAAAGTPRESGENGDASLYLPRSQLDQPPRPLDLVEIDYPPGAPLGDFNAVLLLFVDESGRVQRIRVRDGSLPDSLERAAVMAFHAVQFAPGQRHGRAVKSLYPVAVDFSTADAVRNAGVR